VFWVIRVFSPNTLGKNTLQNTVIHLYQTRPYEKWSERKPSLSYLRTWRCLAKVNIPIPKKQKLRPKTVDYIFLGYAPRSVGYRFLVVKFKVPNIHVYYIMANYLTIMRGCPRHQLHIYSAATFLYMFIV
jgi:hypothetical protein